MRLHHLDQERQTKPDDYYGHHINRTRPGKVHHHIENGPAAFIVKRPLWQKQALCRGDAEWWRRSRSHAGRAGNITTCQRCPSQPECAQAFLDEPTDIGGVVAGVYVRSGDRTLRPPAIEALRRAAAGEERATQEEEGDRGL